MRKFGKYELTPIEEYNKMLFKRDDLYLPFPDLPNLGGGKVRQMELLAEDVLKNEPNKYNGFITYCSVSSPQSIIISKVAYDHGLQSMICVGANSTIDKLIQKHKPLRYSKLFNSEIKIVAGIGYNNVLENRAKKLAELYNLYLVHFGINLFEFPSVVDYHVGHIVWNMF